MKKIMLVGSVGCGKTTLCQRINRLEQRYKKTQALEVINTTIDTPGEYLERRSCLGSLLVTSCEVDLVLFLLDATESRFMYSPGQATSFPVPVMGVVTKTDLASAKQRSDAIDLLELAGAERIFEVSSVDGEGIEALIDFLSD
ncbi:MAG: EutP/PduV family microcompartment system protein [Clostridia bacterium]|nr:EutP/PduV family microcompartment system protein [Clostridia bacterium]MBR4954340.1 EutP/PduV family microcompartment system protein [Clostridia bacterium]MBR5903784.1 EutP/PduV family microcompartment system protein [Clostridia bacterium]